MTAKPYRPSVLSAAASTWAHQSLVMEYLGWFRARSLNQISPERDVPLRLLYDWLERGYGLNVGLSALTCLRVNEVATLAALTPRSDASLVLPTLIHFDEKRRVVHYMRISAAEHNGLKRWARQLASRAHSKQVGAYAIPTDTTDDSMDHRFRVIGEHLRLAHAEHWALWRSTVPSKQTVSLSAVASTLSNLAVVTDKVAPAVSVALGQLPLPADANPAGAQISPQWPPPYALALAKARATHPRDFPAADSLWDPSSWDALKPSTHITAHITEDDKAAWALAAKAAVQDAGADIAKRYKSKRLGEASQAQLVAQLNEVAVEHAETLHPTSVAWLGLLWVASLLCNQRIAPPTARQYLTEVVSQALVHHPAAIDLSTWDDEDVDTAFELLVDSRDLNENTLKQRAHRLLAFLGFCQSLGLMADCTLPTIQGDYLATRMRNRLITPSTMDAVIASLVVHARPASDAAAALCLLGFYLGLRASEVLALEIRDIDGACELQSIDALSTVAGVRAADRLPPTSQTVDNPRFLRVRRGKSPSARRKLPLWVLLPPHVMVWLDDIISRRRAQFPRHKTFGRIRVLGPEGDPAGLDYESIAQVTLSYLRSKIHGGMDLHTLRHNFATWWLVRWLQAFDPKSWQLSDSHHPLFEVHLQQTLRDYLSWGRCDDSTHHHWLELAKLMGHSHFGVTRATYVHSLSATLRE